MILNFGKHNGEDIVDIPTGYLKWLESQDWIKDELRTILQFEINSRASEITSQGRVIGNKKFVIHIYDSNVDQTIEITLTLPVAITELPKLNFKGSGCEMWKLVKIDKS